MSTAELERALSAAVRASLPLPQAHRAAFLSGHLLAQLEKSELPVAAGERHGKPSELHAELQTLSDMLTGIVNASRSSPDWPIKAVATALANPPPPFLSKDRLAEMEAEKMKGVATSEASVATSATTSAAPSPAAAAPAAAAPAAAAPTAAAPVAAAPDAAAVAAAAAAPVAASDAAAPAAAAPTAAAPAAVTPTAAAAPAAASSPPAGLAQSPSKKVMFTPGEIPMPKRLMSMGSSFSLTDSFDGLTALSPSNLGIPEEAVEAVLASASSDDPFRVSMRTGIIRRKSFREQVPEAKIAEVEQLREKDEMEHVRAVARLAFDTYDKDKSGTIDKEELFLSLMELGRVAPANYGAQSQIDYLEANFRLADTNGDGEVDFDEFVAFYASTLHAVEMEETARKAFSKYDVDESNTLEKHELFQALLELNMVPGMDLKQKREYLEEQFNAADSNGDGVVDFAEFVAFYVTMVETSKGEEGAKRRQKAEKQRLERLKRQASYTDPEAILTALKGDEVVLVRASWLLKRAGYVVSERERKGRKVYSWTLPAAAADETPSPLPCRQQLQAEAPDALIGAAELSSLYEKFLKTLEAITPGGVDPKERWEGVRGLPVVLASHCWQGVDHPDPNSKTLRMLAKTLAAQLPTYQLWGFDDVGVFIDWCSIYQETKETPRTPQQVTMFHRAKNQMCVWFAHRQTTVYLLTQSGTLPAAPDKDGRGWPFFEEAACRLFKPRPPDRPYKLPHGALAPAWPKVVDAAAKDRADEKKRLPPMSAPHFQSVVTKGAMKADLTRDAPKKFADPLDVRVVTRLYRRVVEDGFSSLNRLDYARLEWGNEQMSTFAATLDEVPCTHVMTLDLSHNDFSVVGMDALAHAISLGALSSLQVLNLAHCTALHSLPEAIGRDLTELHTLILDGCVGLKGLPKSLSTCACLRKLHVHCCHGLTVEMFKALPATVEVQKDAAYVPFVLGGTPAATPAGTPRQ